MLARTLFLIIVFGYALSAFSACDPALIAHVSRHLVHVEFEDSDFKYVACKPHPDIKNASIVAIASKQLSLPSADDENYNLNIALVDTNSEKILVHKFYEAKLPNGGGPRLTGIEVDTAKYFVSPGSRAFGIRANLSMGFTSSQELSLFLIRDKHFEEILSGAEMQIFFTNRWPSCKEKNREAKRTLGIDKNLTDGFYDLLVTERLTDSEEHTDRSGDCNLVVTNVETKKYRLKYDGTRYVIPNEMRQFDCKVC